MFIISSTYGFLLLTCLVFWPQLRFLGLSATFWQSIGISGLLATLGNVFLVKALHIGNLSVLGPINAYKSVVGLLIGMFLLNEIPGLWGLAGILLIVVGSYIVLSDQKPQAGLSWAMFQRPEVKFEATGARFLRD